MNLKSLSFYFPFLLLLILGSGLWTYQNDVFLGSFLMLTSLGSTLAWFCYVCEMHSKGQEPPKTRGEHGNVDIPILPERETSLVYFVHEEKCWICGYCNTVNDWGNKTCHYCGSPRRKNK